jgi:hypothetical protein
MRPAEGVRMPRWLHASGGGDTEEERQASFVGIFVITIRLIGE